VFVNRQTPRTRSLRAAIAVVGVFAITAAACSDDKNDAVTTTSAASGGDSGGVTSTTETPLPPGDIVATALTNHVFTQLAGMVVDAGLVETLRGGPFTVFAPTDTAFAKLPVDMLHAVQDADGGKLVATVLTHHVVAGTITPDQLVAGPLTTVAGTTITITKVGDSFYADGNLIGAGVEATNGYVYVMNDVLVPAIGDIVDVAVAFKDCCFSTLVELVTQAELVDTLKGEGPFTVFAPANAAFEALPADTLAAVAGSATLLAKVLTYHVVPGKITIDQLTDGQKLTTVAGVDLTVTITEETVTVGGTTSVQKVVNIDGNPILVQNVQATNGVIHVMGAVLVPA